MKTSTIKSVSAIIFLFFSLSTLFSQNAVGIRIDVKGTRYSDQMWIFSVPTTTRAFDNGWDGYKMFGTSTKIPQIFAMEETGNFQVNAVPDMNETYIAFKAGQDTVYTLHFTTQNLSTYYQALYIKDLDNNTVTDIFSVGATYTFNVKPTVAAVKRFVILTSLPIVEAETVAVEQPNDIIIHNRPIILPGVSKDSVVAVVVKDSATLETAHDSISTEIIDTMIVKNQEEVIVFNRPIVLPEAPKDTVVAVEPTDTIAIVADDEPVVKNRPIVLPEAPKDAAVAELIADSIPTINFDNSNELVLCDTIEAGQSVFGKDRKYGNDRNNIKNSVNKLAVRITKSQIIVENLGDKKGQLRIVNAMDGKCIREYIFDSKSTTNFDIDFRTGTYVVLAISQNQTVSKLASIR